MSWEKGVKVHAEQQFQFVKADIMGNNGSNNDCVDMNIYKSEHKNALQHAVEVVKFFKEKTHSKRLNFDYVFNRSMDNMKQNRTYEGLLEMLRKGNFIFCEDMFARKLEIPWTESQRQRENKFRTALQQRLRDVMLKTKRVRMKNMNVKSKLQCN